MQVIVPTIKAKNRRIDTSGEKKLSRIPIQAPSTAPIPTGPSPNALKVVPITNVETRESMHLFHPLRFLQKNR